MPSSPTIWPVCQPRRFRGCGHVRLCGAALRKERTVKRDVRDYTLRWGFLAIARPSDRAFKSKRLSHHAPSGWRCPATLYKIGAKFALALLWRAKPRGDQAPARRSVSPVRRQEYLRLNGTHPRSGFHTGDWRHRQDPGERSQAALEAALDRFNTAFRA